jgi:hypothetical protein
VPAILEFLVSFMALKVEFTYISTRKSQYPSENKE